MVFDGMGCTGDNRSPDLAWSGAPDGTKSYAITMYDPDAPTTVGFWHWILFDVRASETSIAAGAGKKHHQPHGSTLGFTDFGSREYGGPCPPPGDPPHRYQINVYALDVDKLGADDTTTGAKLMFMMRGHVLAKGTLEGTYGR
ncbi:MAG: YbhB/YbcL family Raf kinase inhibitor-like protein [Candidatus Velthaea sp.]